MRARSNDGVNGVVAVIEIGGEDLDDGGGIQLANGFDCLPEMAGAAIGKVIAGDGGDDDVLEAHPAGGLGDAQWFISLKGQRFGGGDGAEGAGARAAITGD